MDLKIFQSHSILHFIDHVTRFSATDAVKSKERNETINIFLVRGLVYLVFLQNILVTMEEYLQWRLQ